ncbi:MAG: 50S ribosomal protein L21 [Bdellovibrionales bacterium]|nr:50S ribosomal protein L21 [Bdellovibrionales bacterium]
MFAVVRTGGKQYRVEPGSVIDVEKLSGEVGDAVEFGEVLLIADGEKVSVGRPMLDGAKIAARIVAQHRGPKAVIFKKIRRHGKQLKKGHRQALTRVEVEEIRA